MERWRTIGKKELLPYSYLQGNWAACAWQSVDATISKCRLGSPWRSNFYSRKLLLLLHSDNIALLSLLTYILQCLQHFITIPIAVTFAFLVLFPTKSQTVSCASQTHGHFKASRTEPCKSALIFECVIYSCPLGAIW